MLTPSIALGLLSLLFAGYVSICVPKSGNGFPRFPPPFFFSNLKDMQLYQLENGVRGAGASHCQSVFKNDGGMDVSATQPGHLSSLCPGQKSPGPGPCLWQGAVSSHGTGAVQPSTLTVPGVLRGSAQEEREPSGLQAS